MKNLRLALAALVFALPLAACTQQVGEEPSTSSSEPVAAEAKVAELTKVEAKFARWIPTPGGQTAGMMLEDGTFVRVHPDTKTDGLAAGDLVQVEGIKHDASFALATVKKGDTVIVEAPKDALQPGKLSGKHGKHGKHGGKHFEKSADWEQKKAEWKAAHPEGGKKHWKDAEAALAPMKVSGTVSAVLPGRHGRVHAVLLTDGTVAYAPHRSDAFANVKKGDALELEGKGGSWAIGKSLVVESVGGVPVKKNSKPGIDSKTL